MTANEMAAQLLRETIQQQAVDAVSSTMPRLEAAIKSGAGNNKLSARLPEFQYQLEVRQTGTFGEKKLVVLLGGKTYMINVSLQEKSMKWTS